MPTEKFLFLGQPILVLSISGMASIRKVYVSQGLSQNLETGGLKLAIVKSLGVQSFKGDHNILKFQQ